MSTMEVLYADKEAKASPPLVPKYDELLEMRDSDDCSRIHQAELALKVKIIPHNRSWTLSGVLFQKRAM
jgi:hypothetical protein